MDPMDSTEPTESIDSTEPFDRMDRTEPFTGAEASPLRRPAIGLRRRCGAAAMPPAHSAAMTITTQNAITSSLTDAHGNPTSGPAEAVATYDAAVDRLIRWHPDVLTHAETLATTQPGFAMGHALGAYLSLVSTDPVELPNAAAAADALRQTAGNDRERAHSAAVDAWLAGDWHGASRLLDDLLIRWPADLLALVLGH